MKLAIKKFSEAFGDEALIFELENDNQVSACLTNIGATLVSFVTPDKFGNLADLVMGYDEPQKYLAADNNPYFGCTVGRYANRIANGKFSIAGSDYQLEVNNGPNALHGGIGGFNRKIFESAYEKKDDQIKVTFSRVSFSGEDNYPGNLHLDVSYTLTNDDELIIDYKATSDAPTICNLTNHSYWNLAGVGSGDVLGHKLKINADNFTPFSDFQIPTGQILTVANTPYDFRTLHSIGDVINQTPGGENNGYDHNFVLNKHGEDDLCSLAALLEEPETGRVMTVYTTEPGLQLYTANWLCKEPGKAGMIYHRWGGLCLECQHFPDSPNQPDFPTTLLLPGETYSQKTIHKFSVEN